MALVSIFFGGWRTDLSLNLFVLLVFVACFVMMVGYRSVSGLVSLPQRSREWRAVAPERAAQAALREALAEYFAARYGRAHSAAQKALAAQHDTDALLADADFSALAHLLASASLHRMHDRPRRDEQMRQLKSLRRKAGAARTVDEGARLLSAEWASTTATPNARWNCWRKCRRAWPGARKRCACACRRSAWRASRWQRCTRRACWPSTRPSRRRRRAACCAAGHGNRWKVRVTPIR